MEPSPGKMTYQFKWIPKLWNHLEKVAGKEYTPLPGYFTRGCGGFPAIVVTPRRRLVAALIVGKHSADKH